MPSLFERVSKNLVKELGDKDLKPVKSPLDTNKFRQFALLRKKRKTRTEFWEKPDVSAECSLMDILEPSSLVPETVVTGPFHFKDKVIAMESVHVDVTAGLEVSVLGEAAQSHGSSLEFRSVAIPPTTWEGLQKRKVLEKKLVKYRDAGQNLYVVTEAVELINGTVLQDKSSITALGKFLLPWTTYVQSKVEGGRVRDTTLMLPSGTVMAYKKKQLVFQEPGWGEQSLQEAEGRDQPQAALAALPVEGEEQQDFSGAPSPLQARKTERGPILPVGETDFQYLQEEISWETEALAQLSKDSQNDVFHTILKNLKLKDRGALQDLMDMLDRDPLGPVDSSGGTFLSKMQEDPRNPWLQSRSHIMYLLEAIVALSDTQHELLAWSMEKRILLQQRELVRSILEPNFRYPWSIPVRLQPELLAQLHGEGVAITFALLEECGLRVEPGNLKATWDLEVKKPLCALYAALSGLQQLVAA
uniref:Gasdermin-C n=1 Tax=Sus scrofa TaxID=9823 RepID=A0A8D1I0T0_PIG